MIEDYLLLHDREIVNRVDDSVVRVINGRERVLRRARGYAPSSLPLPAGFGKTPAILALGGELKNSFCLVQHGEAILSQHMGDLEDFSTYEDYLGNLDLYARLYRHEPEIIARPSGNCTGGSRVSCRSSRSAPNREISGRGHCSASTRGACPTARSRRNSGGNWWFDFRIR